MDIAQMTAADRLRWLLRQFVSIATDQVFGLEGKGRLALHALQTVNLTWADVLGRPPTWEVLNHRKEWQFVTWSTKPDELAAIVFGLFADMRPADMIWIALYRWGVFKLEDLEGLTDKIWVLFRRKLPPPLLTIRLPYNEFVLVRDCASVEQYRQRVKDWFVAKVFEPVTETHGDTFDDFPVKRQSQRTGEA